MSREFMYNEDEEEPEGVIFEKLLDRLNDWRSVPEIVRFTFKSLSDIVKSHTMAIRDLEIQIATKANRSELVQKANLTDLNRMIEETRISSSETKTIETIHTLLEEKATRKECQYLISGKFNEIKSELDKKADIRELQNEIRAVKAFWEEGALRKTQSKDLDSIYKLLEEKASIRDVSSALKDKVSVKDLSIALEEKANIRDVNAALEDKASKQSVSTALQKKVNRSDVEYKLGQFDKYIDTLRVSIERAQSALSEEIANKVANTGEKEVYTEVTKITSSMRNDMKKIEEKSNDTILKIEDRIKGLYEEVMSIKSRMGQMASKIEEKDRQPKQNEAVYESIRSDIRISMTKDVEKLVKDISATKMYLEDLINTRVRDLTNIVDQKPNKYEISTIISEQKFHRVYQEDIEGLKKSLDLVMKRGNSEIYAVLDALRNDMMQKVNTQDLLALLKSKPDTQEIKELVMLSLHSNEDKLIIETLCSENCSGRWLWKSGDVRAGYTVPWEIQSVNTCPENFIWEKDSSSVIAVTPGLYEVFFGFFTSKKPVVQFLVNGEAVILDMSSEGKAWGRHRDGNIVGATTTEYVALPARARLSITYSGPRIVEGFLSLRKL